MGGGFKRLIEDKADYELRGTTRDVYRFLLSNRKPIGTRDVQRALKLSTPSLASYHLTKLEDAGLLKKINGAYVVERVILESCVKINHFLIPRYLFYAIFAFTGLLIELSLFQPSVLSSTYLFLNIIVIGCLIAFCYETINILRKGKL